MEAFFGGLIVLLDPSLLVLLFAATLGGVISDQLGATATLMAVAALCLTVALCLLVRLARQRSAR